MKEALKFTLAFSILILSSCGTNKIKEVRGFSEIEVYYNTVHTPISKSWSKRDMESLEPKVINDENIMESFQIIVNKLVPSENDSKLNSLILYCKIRDSNEKVLQLEADLSRVRYNGEYYMRSDSLLAYSLGLLNER